VTDVYAPHLIAAWQAAQTGSVAALIKTDLAFAAALSHEHTTPSCEAGRLLLKGTRGARYQDILGHYRSACEADETPGHFLTVWAAVGHFFQLSLTNVVAEYLRLEWALATRHLPVQPRLHGLPELTAGLMLGRQQELCVVA
ncbi:MAG: urease accessory UreF family protein, partial [Prosthecobacter sp.]